MRMKEKISDLDKSMKAERGLNLQEISVHVKNFEKSKEAENSLWKITTKLTILKKQVWWPEKDII